MEIELKSHDNYVHLQLKDEVLTKAIARELTDYIKAKVLSKGKKNIILSIAEVKTVEKDFYVEMDAILVEVLKQDGMFVISECPEGEVKTKLENKGLILTRSFDEAVDYVFITDIEKDFNGLSFSENDEF